MLDESGWNKEAGVFKTGNSLKGDADNFVILNHRATAVARIDGSVGLRGEVGTVADVDVVLQFDARNDAAGVGNLFAPGGITIRDNGGADLREFAEVKGLHAVEKAFVLHLKNRKITVAGEEFDARNVGTRVLITVHENLPAPVDDVGVGHDALAFDDKTSPRGFADLI